MFTVTVEAGFSALHQLRLSGSALEPLHGHDWRVRAHFGRLDLDDRGMVLDFHEARAALQSVVSRLHHCNLNEHEGISGRNPTAEVVARYIWDRLHRTGLGSVARVDVTEAPGCTATYEAPETPDCRAVRQIDDA